VRCARLKTADKERSMSQELFDRFIKCAVDALKVEADQLTREARFKEDLNSDSLDFVELMMAVEDEFGIDPIDEKELEGIATFGQAFDLIISKL
jgi:acyl carrier protein